MRNRGFTLIELLVVIILIIIIVGSVVVMFNHLATIVTFAGVRIEVYSQARYALERLDIDIKNMLPYNSGQQAFFITDGVISVPSVPQGNAGHYFKASDTLQFIANTIVGTSIRKARITYRLVQDTGPITNYQTYVLVRQVEVQNPTSGQWEPAMEGQQNISQEFLCNYVLSFNVEYYTNGLLYSQSTSQQPFNQTDPLGNNQGQNDIQQAITVPALRVTLIIYDEANLVERVFSNIIYIPQS